MRFALFVLLLVPQDPPRFKWSPTDLKEIAALEKKVASKEDQHTLETEHWRIVTRVTPRFTAEAARYMELVHGVIAPVAGKEPKVAARPTIVIYKGIDHYERRFPDGSRGQFWYHVGGDDNFDELHVYAYTATEAEEKFEFFHHAGLIQHGTRAWFRKVIGKNPVPVWFDEGLGMYYRAWNVQLGAAESKSQRYSRSNYKAHLAQHCRADQGKAIDLKKLFAVGPTEWNPDSMGPIADHNYALSELLFDYLLSYQADHALFNRIWQTFRAGKPLDLKPEEIQSLEAGLRKHATAVLK